jgi:SnoaL-like domain
VAPVPLTTEDRLVIADLVALQGHLFDDGELERLDELFTAEVVYDASDFGQPPMRGIDAIARPPSLSATAIRSRITSPTSWSSRLTTTPPPFARRASAWPRTARSAALPTSTGSLAQPPDGASATGRSRRAAGR